MNKAQETVVVSDSQRNALTAKVSSLTKELSSIRVECSKFRAGLDGMTAIVEQMTDEVGKSLPNVFIEVHKINGNIVRAVKLKINVAIVNRWKKI